MPNQHTVDSKCVNYFGCTTTYTTPCIVCSTRGICFRSGGNQVKRRFLSNFLTYRLNYFIVRINVFTYIDTSDSIIRVLVFSNTSIQFRRSERIFDHDVCFRFNIRAKLWFIIKFILLTNIQCMSSVYACT